MHVLADDAQAPPPGTIVTAAIDWPRRHRLMRFHTALHLLCAVVQAPVSGGRMAPEKAHLDFDIEMDKLVATEIEDRLNALVAADTPVEIGHISDEELDAKPDLVKTMSVQPPRGQEGSVRSVSQAWTCSPAAAPTLPAPARSDRSRCFAYAQRASATSG